MKIYWIVASLLILVGIVIYSQNNDVFNTSEKENVAEVAVDDPSDQDVSSPDSDEASESNVEDKGSKTSKSNEIMSGVSSNTLIHKRIIKAPIALEVVKPVPAPIRAQLFVADEQPVTAEPAATAQPQGQTPVETPAAQTVIKRVVPQNHSVDTETPWSQPGITVTPSQHNTVVESTASASSCPCLQHSFATRCNPVCSTIVPVDTCCAPICTPCETSCCATGCCEYWRSPLRLTLSQTEGRWLDNHQGYTTIGAFAAVWGDGYCRPVGFLDARQHIFNDGKIAGNVGGGLRYAFCDSIVGVNAYYDYRQGSWNHIYRQLGIGFEKLSSCFDVRLNLYFHIGDHNGHSRKRVFDNFIGDFRATCRVHRRSINGGDFEIGRFIFCKDPCNWYDLYAAVGAYYYDYSRHEEHAVGVQARVASNVGRFLTFELKAGYDPVFHGQVQGKITASIPLDRLCNLFKDCGSCSCASPCCDFYRPVVRQEIIALGHKRCCWDWNWSSRGCKDCR